jgi:trimethylamine--corrinoid protein Co-methyltransferase
LANTGRYNVPVGLLNGGKRFSPVQALLDIDIERWIVEARKGIEVSPQTMLVEQIQEVGIGGHNLTQDHTAKSMRKNVWYPRVIDHFTGDIDQEHVNDMTSNAVREIDKFLSRSDLYEAPPEKIRAIERIVKAAEKELLG